MIIGMAQITLAAMQILVAIYLHNMDTKIKKMENYISNITTNINVIQSGINGITNQFRNQGGAGAVNSGDGTINIGKSQGGDVKVDSPK